MAEQANIGNGTCYRCKKESMVVNLDTNICASCKLDEIKEGNVNREREKFDKIAQTCPQFDSGDCGLRVSTVYEYDMNTGQQDIIYECCMMEMCPVWHFVKALKITAG
jgi:hypothetical protein